ncbi:glycosyltransferase family 88 protein [Legionella cardiaca]|uniref:Glycosyltransferase family 88 protein n=1 Tax=Legionella cardiaca TaxID=1071983 RepID=A0ABY8ARW6_9GAMM|nr:glycosyltransferase family 88 protein [Legionella cardiaca]WED41937.1 glycosyltransferase family 88 protein [Legionella cardiaca]
MPYNFNPHRHVKIWLSKDSNSFLNIENQLRLIRMRDINPTDEINFIYDSNLLTPKALEELKSFCEKYKINARDVQEIIPECNTEEEKHLIEVYQNEVSHLHEGGNLAVLSDVLRWLSPIYKLGTYTDFDVSVDTRALPPTITVEKPILFRIGSVAVQGKVESIAINNDTIAVVDNEAALPTIKKIQRAIYTNCTRTDEQLFGSAIEKYRASIEQQFSPLIVPFLLATDSNFQSLERLATLDPGDSSRGVRRIILASTDNNTDYGKIVLQAHNAYEPFMTPEEITKRAASLEREELRKGLGWLSWLITPSFQYKKVKALVEIQDDEEFLKKKRELMRQQLLKVNVQYSSGPGALTFSLFDSLFYERETIDTTIAPSSFSHYDLDNVFMSGNSIPFHTSSREVLKKLEAEVGDINDLSWLEEGQKAVTAREQKIQKAALTFQRFYRGNKVRAQENLPPAFIEMREKIETHIRKIEADLEGCFGFYRHNQRHKKIDALRGLLTYFSEDMKSFDVKKFKSELEQYRSEDIFASIGKSKTKELIDDLTLLSQQAKFYNLADEEGKFAMQKTS